jgi:hypothetical protein
MIVTLKATRCRETWMRPQRSPSISSCHISNYFAFQVKSLDFCKGTRIVDDLNFDASKLHS